MDEVYENNAYWLVGLNGVKEGPFCPNNECLHDNNDNRQRLTDNHNGSFTCPQCQRFIIVNKAEWDAYDEAAGRENDERAKETNKKFFY